MIALHEEELLATFGGVDCNLLEAYCLDQGLYCYAYVKYCLP